MSQFAHPQFVHRFENDVDLISVLTNNPNPLAIDYLIYKSDTMDRDEVIESLPSVLIKSKNPDLPRFLAHLNLTLKEKTDTLTAISAEIVSHIGSLNDFLSDTLPWIVNSYFHRHIVFLTRPSRISSNYACCVLVAKLAKGPLLQQFLEYLANIAPQVLFDHPPMVEIIILMNENPDDAAVQFLTGAPNMIYLPNFLRNKNINAFRYFRDHIFANLPQFCQQTLGQGGMFENPLADELFEDEDGTTVCDRILDDHVWFTLPNRMRDHKEIETFVKAHMPEFDAFVKRRQRYKDYVKANPEVNPFELKDPKTYHTNWSFLSTLPKLFDYDYSKMRKTRHNFDPVSKKFAPMNVGQAIQARPFKAPRVSSRGSRESRREYNRRVHSSVKKWNARLQELGHSPVLPLPSPSSPQTPPPPQTPPLTPRQQTKKRWKDKLGESPPPTPRKQTKRRRT